MASIIPFFSLIPSIVISMFAFLVSAFAAVVINTMMLRSNSIFFMCLLYQYLGKRDCFY